jgi:signal transduction histidine kinase
MSGEAEQRLSSRRLACGPEELRTLFLFEALEQEQLTWLCARGHVEEVAAGRVFSEGEAATQFYVLLEGSLRLSLRVGGDEVELNRTDQRGVYAGAWYAYLGDRVPQVYVHSLDATTPCVFFVLPAESLRELMRNWFPMAVHMLEGLFFGLNSINQTIGQRERLLALGSLSAGLTHELNNPAAAAVRAAASLREANDVTRRTLLAVSNENPTESGLASLVLIQESVLRVVPVSPPPTSSGIARDEDAVLDWLDARSVERGWEYAPVLAQAGVDQEWLEVLAASLGDAELQRSLRWLTSLIETESLISEIEEATARISSLVSAAKQYSQLDRSPYQFLNIHDLLDSTLVMLAARIGSGVKVVKAYDPELPLVPGYGAELNQVWTNLIDNALSAMNGSGTLTIRTLTDDDMAVVIVGDSGPGIAPEVQTRVFEPFFTTKPVGEGTGLGLDISWRIVVNKHHGDILVRSRPGDTEFEIRLPLNATPAMEAVDDRPKEPA